MSTPSRNQGSKANIKKEIEQSIDQAKQLVEISHLGNENVNSRSIIQPEPPIQARPLFRDHVVSLSEVLYNGRIDSSYPLSVACWVPGLYGALMANKYLLVKISLLPVIVIH